ncbi:MAG: TIM barrel protein [Victivallaceae bacterium]|nr:TIM barrel protein [Victivallaceae bacterium]
MLNSGLVSITFRQLTTARIIDIVKMSGLECIEWGGDLHVPHGDLKTARAVRRQCADAKLTLPSYGSYYRAGSDAADNPAINAVLDSAAELGVSHVRIWAGTLGSADVTATRRGEIVDVLHRDSEIAAKYGLKLSLEYHGNTLTDSDESVKQLMTELADTEIQFYWQPAIGKTAQYHLDSLAMVQSCLAHIHAFTWQFDAAGNITRQPLADGMDDWRQLLEEAAKIPGTHAVMLEFVKDDSIEQFMADAKTLRQLLNRQ